MIPTHPPPLAESTTMIAAQDHGMMQRFDRIIPASVRASPAEWQAARNLAILAAITAASVPLLSVMYHLLGYDAAGMMVLTAGVVMMTAPFTLNLGVGIGLARDIFVGALYLLKVWMALHMGGIGAPTMSWFVLCPAVALLLGGLRPGLAWAALVALTVTLVFVFDLAGAIAPAHPVSDPAVLEFASVFGLLALIVIIVALALGVAGVERRGK